MAVLWHPDADRRPVTGRPGKKWDGGTGNPKYLFHTTEITTRWPNYMAPPHLTLNPWTGELRQHVAFNLAAYAVRSSRVDAMRFVYQVEHWGKAKLVPTYPDHWYENVAELIRWFHDNLGVPIIFDDFTNLRYGPLGSRLPYDDVDTFAGIIGHGRVGRGIDTHWDPGALDVPRLEAMLDTVTPPPPPPTLKDDMVWLSSLQRQTPEYFVALAEQTGTPGGSDPGYWGRSHDSSGDRIHAIPTDEEWDNALDVLAAASLEVGVQSGPKGDPGPQGPTGPAGATGEQGEPGPQPRSATFGYN